MKAAKKELQQAQFNVGFFYEKGRGCEIDTIGIFTFMLRYANKLLKKHPEITEGRNVEIQKEETFSTANKKRNSKIVIGTNYTKNIMQFKIIKYNI